MTSDCEVYPTLTPGEWGPFSLGASSHPWGNRSVRELWRRYSRPGKFKSRPTGRNLLKPSNSLLLLIFFPPLEVIENQIGYPYGNPLCSPKTLTVLLWGEYRIWLIRVNWLVLPTLTFATSPTDSKTILVQLTL